MLGTDSANSDVQLYHYTSLETLLKIIETGAIWATSVHYLNDISERLHGLDLLTAIAPQVASNYSRLPFFSWIMREVQQQRELSILDQPFVTSFTAEPNLLPLWLAYCPQGNGVSIGFRTQALQSAWVRGTETDIRFSGKPILEVVKYLDVTDNADDGSKSASVANTKDVTTMLDSLVRGLHGEHPQAGGWGSQRYEHPPTQNQLDEAFAAITQRVREASVSIKRQGFRHESESRLIVSTMESHHNAVKYRSSKTTIVPYVPICLPSGDQLLDILGGERRAGNAKPHFISRVIVGPGSDVELTKKSLLSLFDSLQLSVEVETSNLPFRQI